MTDPEVTLVQIDDSQDRIFESWPLSPGDYALLLQNLRNFEPRLVGIAPSLRWEEPGMLYDSLIRELDAVPETVLGAELAYLEAEDGFVDPALAALFEPLDDVVGDNKRVPVITTVLDLPQDEVRVGRSLGFTRLAASDAEESDRVTSGKFLTVPLLARYGDSVVPGFVLRLFMAHRGVSLDQVRVSLGRWIRIADREIPIDATGAMVVDAGLRGSVPRLNASALLLGADLQSVALSAEESRALDSMKRNVIVIGVDDPASRVVKLPDQGGDGGVISRADLLAVALATIQAGRHVRELELPGRIVLWVLALAGAIALFLLPSRQSLGLGMFLLFGFGVFGLLVFQVFEVWMSPVVPMGTLLVAVIASGLTKADSIAPGEGDGGE